MFHWYHRYILRNTTKVTFHKENKLEKICKRQPIQKKKSSVYMRMLKLFEAYSKTFAKICCGHNFRSWCNQGSLNNRGNLIIDAMVQKVKHWIFQEQNITFPRNKKCLNWFLKTILVLAYRGGSHWIFFNFQRKVIVTKFICTYLYFHKPYLHFT